MPIRKTQQRRLKKYSVGDMRELITIHIRNIDAPSFDSASFSEVYDTGIEHWSFIFTPNLSGAGQRFFGDVNTGERATDVMVIRFADGITKENVVQWDGEYYKILQVLDPERRHEYLELDCKILGDKAVEANQ